MIDNTIKSAIAFILLILFLLTGCDSSNISEWTILVYMAADNSLNEAAIDDINEMESGYFSDDIAVIVQIDSREGNLYDFYPGARRYEILPEISQDPNFISSPLIASMGEIDSGSYQAIADFSNWGFARYPSEKRALVIWSHGNGWYDAYNRFCPDNESGSSISIPEGELAAALSSIHYHLDILLLDACNMQCLEVLAEAYPYTDYIIGSENSVCTDGFPYSDILTSWEAFGPTNTICSEIIDLYINSYLPGGSQYQPGINPSLTASAVDTKKFPQLRDELTQFCELFTSTAGEPYFAQARNNCIEFNDLDADVDLKEFFTSLAEQNVPQELLAFSQSFDLTIEEVFFAYDYYNLLSSQVGTATIWFPDSENTFEDLIQLYNELSLAETGWSNFLSAFLDLEKKAYPVR